MVFLPHELGRHSKYAWHRSYNTVSGFRLTVLGFSFPPSERLVHSGISVRRERRYFNRETTNGSFRMVVGSLQCALHPVASCRPVVSVRRHTAEFTWCIRGHLDRPHKCHRKLLPWGIFHSPVQSTHFRWITGFCAHSNSVILPTVKWHAGATPNSSRRRTGDVRNIEGE